MRPSKFNDPNLGAKGPKNGHLAHIKFKGKRICLLTNYRTGSTFFLRETFQNNQLPLPDDWEYFNQRNFLQAYKKIKRHPEFIFKLMPDQIQHNFEKLDALKGICNQFVYLYRRDFEAQARSWIAWNVSGDHDYHWGNKTRIYDIDVTQHTANRYIDQLIKNYMFIKEIYKKYPDDVYCLEDFPFQKPYTRKYNWISDIVIPPFNPHKEVFRS